MTDPIDVPLSAEEPGDTDGEIDADGDADDSVEGASDLPDDVPNDEVDEPDAVTDPTLLEDTDVDAPVVDLEDEGVQG